MKDIDEKHWLAVDNVARRLLSGQDPKRILFAGPNVAAWEHFSQAVRVRMAELEPERCAACRKIRPWCEC